MELTPHVEGTIGSGFRIEQVEPVHGGSINHAACVHGRRSGPTASERFFVKWNRGLPVDAYEAETDGLAAMRGSGTTLRIPTPLGHGHSGGLAWLVLEYIDEGVPGIDFGADLAVGLAQLHDAPHREGALPFGWARPNFIGPLAQPNPPSTNWGRFWTESRVRPHVEAAWAAGRLGRTPLWTRLLDSLEDAAEHLEVRPGLLHGDLWSGNVFADSEGRPTVFDPAVYRGNVDVDLAMAQLFGGFPAGFEAVYREIRGEAGVARTVAEARTAYHQLYPLLVHVRLFGGSYRVQAERAARRVLDVFG